ncbi:MAG TPA: tRNA pseudouridine(55) synthase TruB [Gammaproteobacteria bacterium]|nr:tRNA pseudouridine(55) synthase TruB [Gammaproteobacteria bacterium]
MDQSEKCAIDGIVLLDKPSGMTSNAALQKVKNLFKAKKAGHTGSLDPLASGLLPICLGHATKISQFLLNAQKSYRVTALLGTTTNTGDREGEVIASHPVPSLSETQVEAILKEFLGEQAQIPPMYSALKHKGQRLYHLARKGETVERESRVIHIYELKLLGLEKTEEAVFLSMFVRCSKGTYVRTLVEDVGRILGCGAQVWDLRRVGLGPFASEDMVSLDTLRGQGETLPTKEAIMAHLLPIERALTWPSIHLSEASAFYLSNGQAIQVSLSAEPGWVQLFGPSGHLMGIGEMLADGRVAPKRLFLS